LTADAILSIGYEASDGRCSQKPGSLVSAGEWIKALVEIAVPRQENRYKAVVSALRRVRWRVNIENATNVPCCGRNGVGLLVSNHDNFLAGEYLFGDYSG
jgi:hypothetical protein